MCGVTMKLKLHIVQGRHNVVHRILLSIDDEQPILTKITPRDLGGLAKAGFSSMEVANATKELIERGATVLEGADLDENYVRQFFAEAVYTG